MSSPKRQVVFATTVFGQGAHGPETYARYLWEAFRDDPEIEFHLVAPELPETHLRWHPSGKGSDSFDLYARNARTALQVAQALNATGQKTILHVNTSSLHASLLAYAGPLWGQVNDYENVDLWRRAVEILKLHGPRRFLSLWRRRRLERRFVARQELSLCNSEYTRNRILSGYRPVHRERVVTLYKAVDVGYFQRPSQLPPDPLGRGASSRKFVFVGGNFTLKGLDVLLRAVGQLPSSLDWHLTVVGPVRAEVARVFPYLLTRDTAAHVTYAGRLEKEQLRQVLWHSDVFVLPTRVEAFGVSLLEAMAAGLPVVASRVGGIPEIVRDATAGLLIPVGDAAGLAHAMQEVRPWPQGVLPAPVREIVEGFSTQVMIRRLRELYLRADCGCRV